jgi:hypothetical protein
LDLLDRLRSGWIFFERKIRPSSSEMSRRSAMANSRPCWLASRRANGSRGNYRLGTGPSDQPGTRSVQGPTVAPISLVEFSDFECPNCAEAAPIIHQLRTVYSSRVHFAFKHCPLPVHKESPDSGALIARLALTDAHSFRIREANADAGRGEEDQGFDLRRAFPAERILFAEKSGEFAGLGVRQSQGGLSTVIMWLSLFQSQIWRLR